MSTVPPPIFGVAPLRASLLEDPLAFLSAEHLRQMVLLAHLERLARAPGVRGARAMAGVLLRWLTEELPVHIADEERSLYPRLQQHDVGGHIRRLRAHHRRDARLATAIVEELRRLQAGEAAGAGFETAATDLARLHRAHLQYEEERLTPIARAALTPDALHQLAGEMAARRGLEESAPCPTER
jgi:iron-sulfur cluster repair protein YtfE (RIC family)